MSNAMSDDALRAALRARQADTLAGELLELDEVRPICVEISVARVCSGTLTGQHLAFHLTNLVARLEGVVESVRIALDDTRAVLLPGIDPRAPDGGGALCDALLGVAALAAPHRVASRPYAPEQVLRVRIGEADAQTAAVYASASDWVGYVGRRAGPACGAGGARAFGAHVSAALAVGEIFRIARARDDLRNGPDSLFFSAWTCRAVAHFGEGEPNAEELARISLRGAGRFTLAGVGAVGCACLLTLWASRVSADATAVDGDSVSSTNLGRYVLFGLDDVGEPKVDRAALLLGGREDSSLVIDPVERWWADHQRRVREPIALLASAVDKNSARHQLQDALPRLIVGASTRQLRAQVARYDLADARSACLKCHNPPELVEPDEAVKQRLLSLDPAGVVREAEDRRVEVGRLAEFLADLRRGGTGCAVMGGADLDKLRHTDGEGEFAVSFVSAMAGTLLAAQLVRETSGTAPALIAPVSRGNFTFWRPGANVNQPRETEPQGGCWCSEEIRRVHRAFWVSAPVA